MVVTNLGNESVLSRKSQLILATFLCHFLAVTSPVQGWPRVLFSLRTGESSASEEKRLVALA